MMKNRVARPAARLALMALASAALLAPAAGCLYSSSDSYPYVSRTWSPKTVVLVDTRTGEELWRYDLAVGDRLRVRFFQGDKNNLVMPDEMRWEVQSVETGKMRDSGELPSPPEGVRRIDWYERPAPEYPKPDAPRGEPSPIPDPVEPADAPEGGDDGD